MGFAEDSNTTDQFDNEVVVIADKDDPTKKAKIDSFGSIYQILKDISGNSITSTSVYSKNGLDVNVINGINGGNGIPVSLPGESIFGDLVTSKRNNQIEIPFDNAFDSNLVTNTTSGTGSATQSAGHALYSTGTGSAGNATGVSVNITKYRPGNEVYSYFTAAFTSPVASSYQRIGLYDANNGFFIGYENTTFGVTLRTGGVDTRINASSFNVDLLNGSATSKFTRNGVPEAIDYTYSNVYRIRFGWLGSGIVNFEVFSPDGYWVIFHTIRIPNTQITPSIQNPDLPMRCESVRTAGSANLTIYTGCWAAGTTSDLSRIVDPVTDYSLSSLTRSVIVGKSSSGGGTYVPVKVTPSGSLTVAIGDITGVDGQTTMANSFPVVIASDQTAIPVKNQDGSGNNITSSSGEMDVRDSIQVSGVNGSVSVGTSAIEAKVGASKLSGRKSLTIVPTNGTVYWGLSSGVTTSNGTPIFKNQMLMLDYEISVYLIASTTVDVRVTEAN